MIQEVLLARYFDPPNFTKCFYPMTNLNLTSTYVQACSLLFRTIVSCCIHLIFELSPKEMPQIFSQCSVGCPTSYSCHVDSVLLYSKFEAKQIKYWNSKFKYLQIRYSSIPRRTWLFQILLRDIRDIRETDFNV